MPNEFRYRGQSLGRDEVNLIREFIAAHPASSRWKLSRQLCEALGWKQANGALRDVVCRGLLLALERAGAIELPAVRWRIRGQCRNARPRPEAVWIDVTPIRGAVGRTGAGRTGRGAAHGRRRAVQQPDGAASLPGLPTAGGRALEVSGPGARTASGLRSLRHLASHLLGRMTALLSAEWERTYAHPLYLAETFVDPTRFPGTCYRAANWIAVGATTGRGKDDQTHRPNRSMKEVLVYPLDRRFRQWLKA